jgi:hypothetical protein
MAIKSYAQQLEEVQTAIAKIESKSQSHTVGERTLNRADLATLYQREQWLRGMAAREARGGGLRSRYGVPQ